MTNWFGFEIAPNAATL